MITYTKAELLKIGELCYQHKQGNCSIFKQSQLINVKSTDLKRGVRGGKRRIKPIITVREPKINTNHVNHNNLISICPIKVKPDSKQNTCQFVNLCLVNSRSVRNKADELHEFIIENDFDLFASTETWLKHNDSFVINKLIPDNYKYFLVNRCNRNGGGVALIHKESINVMCVAPSTYSSFEVLQNNIQLKSCVLRIVIIYRPPQSRVNKCSIDIFLDEFSDFLHGIQDGPEDFIILGDFNIHVDKSNDSTVNRFKEVLNSFNLKQHVSQPTHKGGHILDLVITRANSDLIKSLKVEDNLISDHYCVITELIFAKPKPKRTLISYRNTKNLCVDNFKTSIISSKLLDRVQGVPDVDDQIKLYNAVLTNILDEHAPVVTRNIILRPNRKWFSDDIRQSKIDRRQAEKRWRKSKLEIDRDLYKQARNETNCLISLSKRNYISNSFIQNKKNPRQIYKLTSSFLKNQGHRFQNTSTGLTEKFSTFFHEKIDKIRSEFPDHVSIALPEEKLFAGSSLTSFSPTSNTELKDLISKSSSSSCNLDPIPTWLLKQCINELLPIITHIANTSILHGNVSQFTKIAHVKPLLKKPNLDPDNLKNFRPVSNLSYISKLIEKVISTRLKHHFVMNNLDEQFQSAYKKGHSTETALLRVYNDIVTNIDNKQPVVLVLLDLSAAFDTIDHDVLLNRLQTRFGVDELCLKWIRSYLTDRSQYVVMDNATSSPKTLRFGVPQGSVLGPLLFTAYTTPIGDIIRKHGINFHIYADDTQLYLALKPSNDSNEICKLEACIDDIKNWMNLNFLKLNDDKTEVILISRKSLSQAIKIGDSTITSSHSVKNLGVYFDHDLKMKSHISTISKSLNFHLYNIGKLRPFITSDIAKMLTNAFVLCKLDYCNSLLYQLPASDINRLQKIQNKAARIVSLTKQSEHITPVLQNLHWLPVYQRIHFKIGLLTFNCLNNSCSPQYLNELLTPYKPFRNLRSAEKNLLHVPTVKTKMGERAFVYASANVWNALPSNVKNSANVAVFKRNLKTELFKRAFKP
ncbi:hypothetical protein SNE40_020971 [Patella caerulea]|uniref:Reverse transcriptase domain-containing protein n=1 Tax=Patella caerulea TaxID=87958 RepID=A0AAN8J4G9_PATCE